jgi:hypothetical protein
MNTIKTLGLGANRCCNNNIHSNTVGPQGFIGNLGPIGNNGESGPTGSYGPTGKVGLCFRGYRGAIGSIGNTGGITGPTGPAGPIGGTGPINPNMKNIYDSFTINHSVSYNSTPIEITQKIYSITLDNGSYAISGEINESWSDPNNAFYITLLDSNNTTINTTVFTQSKPYCLKTDKIINRLYGNVNDVVELNSNSNSYTLQLYQYNTKNNTIIINNKKVSFSITFIPIS